MRHPYQHPEKQELQLGGLNWSKECDLNPISGLKGRHDILNSHQNLTDYYCLRKFSDKVSWYCPHP